DQSDTVMVAGVRHDVLAYIAGQSQVSLPGGAIQIEARSIATPTADAEGDETAAASSSGLQTEADMTGLTLAYVGEGATVTAGTLTVTATQEHADATATSNVTGFSLVSADGCRTTSSVSGHVDAFVGRAGFFDDTLTSRLPLPTGDPATTTLTLDGNATVEASSA